MDKSLQNLYNRVYNQKPAAQPKRALTYREKLNNFMNNAAAAYSGLGKTRYTRQIKYYQTMADIEDNGLDIKQIAPNYTYIDNLMKNEKAARADIGDREYEKTFSRYYNLAKDDIKKIETAVKLKSAPWDADILEASPELANKYSYSDEEEDQIRKYVGKMPKSFTDSSAKAIIKAANELRKSRMTAQEQANAMAEGYDTTNYWTGIDESRTPTKQELIESIQYLNKASGIKSQADIEAENEAQRQAFQGTIQSYGSQVPSPISPEVRGAMEKFQSPVVSNIINDREKMLQVGDEKEAARIPLREDFKKQVEAVSGIDYQKALTELRWFKSQGFGEGQPETNPYLKLDKLIEDAPPEAFIPTPQEMEQNYKAGANAFISGAGSGLSMGLDELVHKGGEIKPEMAKEAAKKGIEFLYAQYKNGKYYIPSQIEQNQILQSENPIAFLAGNVAGSVPAMVATGGIAAGAATALKATPMIARAAAGFLPNALRSGIQSAARGDDAGKVALNTLIQGSIGAFGQGVLSPAVEKAVGSLLQNAPGIVNKAISNVGGSVAYSAADILGRSASSGLTGRKMDWQQELSNVPVDLITGLIFAGWSNKSGKMPDVSKPVVDPEIYVHPVTGEDIAVPAGKSLADVNPEAASMYGYMASLAKTEPVKTESKTPPVPKFSKAETAPVNKLPAAPKIGKVRQGAQTIADTSTKPARTSKVAQSAYKYTGDEVLKKNLDGGVYDFIPKNDVAQYEAAVKKVDTDGIKSVTEKYANPVESFSKNGNTKTEARRYNDDDAAEVVASLAKAYETGDKTAQQELLSIAMDMGLSGGRMTNMWKMLKKLDGTGYTLYLNRAIKKINAEGQTVYKNKWNDVSLSEAEINTLRSGKTQADFKTAEKQIYKRINQELPSTWTEKDAAWRRIAMLLNPTTHVRNFTGNTIMAGAVEVRDKLIGVMELARKKENRTKALIVKPETMQKAKDYYKETNVAEEMAGIKYEIGRIQTTKGQKRIFKNKVLNALDNATKTTLKWEDDLFKKGRYEKSLARLMDARGLKEVTPEAHEFAMQDALEATFQDRSEIANALQNLKRKGKGVGAAFDVVVPFVTTPVNVTRRAIEYSPFGLGKGGYDFIEAHKVNAEIKKIDTKLNAEGLTDIQIKDLKNQRAQYADDVNLKIQKGIKEVAQGMTGAGIYALGMLIASGQLIPGVSITGLAPASQKEEEFLRDTGWQPLALKVGDTYISIDWATPISPILIAGAQTYHEITSGKPDDALNIPIQAVVALADTITNSSMFTGLRNAISNNKDFGEIVVGVASNYLGQHVPTLAGKANATTEPSEVSSYSKNPLENLKNRAIMAIPGLRQSLVNAGMGDKLNLPMPTLNSWGKEKSTGDIGTRVFNNLLNPAKVTKQENSTVNNELVRLYQSTGKTDVFPAVLSASISVNEVKKILGVEKVTLTEQELYNLKKKVGQAYYEVISKYMNSPGYKSDSDKTRTGEISKIYSSLLEAYRKELLISKLPPAPKMK